MTTNLPRTIVALSAILLLAGACAGPDAIVPEMQSQQQQSAARLGWLEHRLAVLFARARADRTAIESLQTARDEQAAGLEWHAKALRVLEQWRLQTEEALRKIERQLAAAQQAAAREWRRIDVTLRRIEGQLVLLRQTQVRLGRELTKLGAAQSRAAHQAAGLNQATTARTQGLDRLLAKQAVQIRRIEHELRILRSIVVPKVEATPRGAKDSR